MVTAGRTDEGDAEWEPAVDGERRHDDGCPRQTGDARQAQGGACDGAPTQPARRNRRPPPAAGAGGRRLHEDRPISRRPHDGVTHCGSHDVGSIDRVPGDLRRDPEATAMPGPMSGWTLVIHGPSARHASHPWRSRKAATAAARSSPRSIVAGSSTERGDASSAGVGDCRLDIAHRRVEPRQPHRRGRPRRIGPEQHVGTGEQHGRIGRQQPDGVERRRQRQHAARCRRRRASGATRRCRSSSPGRGSSHRCRCRAPARRGRRRRRLPSRPTNHRGRAPGARTLRGVPKCTLVPASEYASSSVIVLPTTVAPAATSRCTAAALVVAGARPAANVGLPAPVTVPATSNMSLTARRSAVERTARRARRRARTARRRRRRRCRRGSRRSPRRR